MSRFKKAFYLSSLALLLVVVSGCTISLGQPKNKAVDGGVWKSTDSGKTWNQTVVMPSSSGSPRSISDISVGKMIYDPQDYNAIYLATNANGIIYTYDGGQNWQQFKQLIKGKINDIAVDPEYKCVLYALGANKLFKSADCGRSWVNSYFHQNSTVSLTSIVINQSNHQVVYVATSEGEIIKSINSGETWTTVFRALKGSFVDLIMDPKDSKIIYVATAKDGIYKTVDDGITWNSLGEGLKLYSGSHEYKDLIVDPATAGGLILISKFGMIRSRDGGVTWDIINLLPDKTIIYSVAVNPQNSNEIYYSTRSTLLKSTDGGVSWSSQELPFSRVANSILIDPENPAVVYLGTFNVK
ncbi:MAG TPA: YCF48-related protein [Patescibacteria group bacterium]|nr:YCF48-related protein [Patescibacteria group bacterium]